MTYVDILDIRILANKNTAKNVQRFIFSGMASSFTTILIEHYEQSFPSARDPHVVEAMLGTFQDIPPILVAVLGGFLQQVTSRPPTFCNDNLISNSRHSTSIITNVPPLVRQ